MSDPAAILKARYDHDLVDALLSAYKEIETNYALRKWKASELDAGHFVESVRRILEFELFGSFTPISSSISKFSDATIAKYEQATGDESYRMLIPRALKSVYNIRNKRGVGHISGVSPNEMDSTYILYTVKWVLAELVRLASGLSVEKTQALIDKIVERRIEVVWKHGDVTRILDSKMPARDQVLVLLYDQSPQSDADLQRIIEYSHSTNFKKILKRLHSPARLIEYQANGQCIITSKGIREAEAIINKTRS